MFHDSYAAARGAFRDLARTTGFELTDYELVGVRGVDDEALSIDVATKGTGNQLILTSGVHGVEGYAGSACQLDCIKNIDFDGIRVVFIHAINPYGFSFKSRTNENQVDLNRNCGDRFPQEFNPEYDAIHDRLGEILHRPSMPDIAVVRETLVDTAHDLSEAVFASALAGGQFRHPDGLFYGGSTREESWLALEQIIGDTCANRGQRTLAIDIHTGLGPPGHGEIIYLGGPDDSAHRFATDWLDGVKCPARGDSVTKEVSGSAVQFFVRDDLGEEVSHVGLEFGTMPFHDVIAALCLDAWLRNRNDVPADTASSVRQLVLEAFCGMTVEWKCAVLERFRKVVSDAVAALRE